MEDTVSQRSAGRTAATATGTAAEVAGTSAGVAAQRAGAALARAGTVLERQSTETAPALGAAVGSAVETAVERMTGVADRVGTVVESVGSTVGGLVEEPGARGGAALDALRGARVGPPVAVRRWPWALGAALLGAAAGAAAALLVHRLQGSDAPGAQEPHELRAVVDLPADGPPP
jgi:hypothetical protein